MPSSMSFLMNIKSACYLVFHDLSLSRSNLNIRRMETFLSQLLYAANNNDNCQVSQIAKLVVVEITGAYHDSYSHRVVQTWKGSQEVIQSDLLLKTWSAMRSGQVSQRFIQSGLEILPETEQPLWATSWNAYLSSWLWQTTFSPFRYKNKSKIYPRVYAKNSNLAYICLLSHDKIDYFFQNQILLFRSFHFFIRSCFLKVQKKSAKINFAVFLDLLSYKSCSWSMPVIWDLMFKSFCLWAYFGCSSQAPCISVLRCHWISPYHSTEKYSHSSYFSF